MTTVHRYGCFETAIDLSIPPGTDVLRDVQVTAALTAPSGRTYEAPGFWDGGSTWRIRFSPDEDGQWHWSIRAPIQNPKSEIQNREGHFTCVPYTGDNPLYVHGPLRMASDRRHLEHADGTPFFWLADTVWNGPMLSNTEEWAHYLGVRHAQGFTVAQYVSTSWRTAPHGGPDGPTYARGADGRLTELNQRFFQHMDARVQATVDTGLACAPVLLWAIGGGENADANPGHSLSEDDCVLLARYQIARWGAYPTVWILNGDGRYFGDVAERWRRIGRRVFPEGEVHAPAAVHPGGTLWMGEEFGAEPWLDILGYQSGHGDSADTWRWLVDGPPAQQWSEVPRQAVINLEPPYEHHLAYHSRQPHSPLNVRRACYWSLLVSPTAGVTYGGHGIWGWDDGSGPPVAHPNTGTPLPWRQALQMPGAQQMRHLRDAFQSIPWWTLRPDHSLLRAQPGEQDVTQWITAARSEDGSLAAIYTPAGGAVSLDTSRLPAGASATWLNPRDGSRTPTTLTGGTAIAPDPEDWLLILSPLPLGEG